jgi:hypothetical protein
MVLVIPCLVLGVCFGLRVSDFGFPRSGWRQFHDAPERTRTASNRALKTPIAGSAPDEPASAPANLEISGIPFLTSSP